MPESKISALRAGIEKLVARFVTSETTPSQADPRLVEVATRALDSRLDRWIRLPAMRQLIGGLEHDALTGPGEWVELRGCHALQAARQLMAPVGLVVVGVRHIF